MFKWDEDIRQTPPPQKMLTSRAIAPARLNIHLAPLCWRIPAASTRCYSRPSYSGRNSNNDGSLADNDKDQASYNDSYDNRPSYIQHSPYSDRQSSRPSYNDRPLNDNRPPYIERSPYRPPNNDRSSNNDRPPYTERSSYNDHPLKNTNPSFRDRSFNHNRPSYNDRPSYKDRNSSYDTRNSERRERRPAKSQDGDRVSSPLRKKQPTIAEETIVPQLSRSELSSIYSQELFVFRCDLNAAQVAAAMHSYSQLRDVGVLTPDDIANLARQLHTRYRIDRAKLDIVPNIITLIKDMTSKKIPGHPLASVHILGTFKEMEEFERANNFWVWLVDQNEEYCDARVYGAAIESFAYQGETLDVMEKMYTEAIERYANNVIPLVSRDTGKGTRLMLFQGIITARLLHGDWQAAYEGFDICVRLYPTTTPSRLYELIIYERPVKEAYIVLLVACRAGTPPKPTVLTPLLKQLWIETGDLKAMIRALYAYVGAGGKPSFHHLNSVIGAILSGVGTVSKVDRTGKKYDDAYANALSFIRDLIEAFGHAGVPPSLSTFNTIVSLGGKLGRVDLVYGGLKEMAAARLDPSLITYRVILNSFGELYDAEAVVTSWKDLCNAKAESLEPWDMKDLRALIRACIRTSQVAFARSELQRLETALGWTLYRTATEAIPREEQKLFHERISSEITAHTGTVPPPLTPESQAKVRTEIQTLRRIFASSQIHDFAADGGFLGIPAGNEKVVDIDSVAPSFPEVPQTELQKFYDTLTSTVSKVDIGEDPLQRTATGYTVKELRFENWRSVNRLLYEAELHEQEMAEKHLKMVKRHARGWALEEEGETKEKLDVRKLFANEERAKKRIEELRERVKGVEAEREVGGVGWKKEEMRVRGRMGGEVGSGVVVEDKIVP